MVTLSGQSSTILKRRPSSNGGELGFAPIEVGKIGDGGRLI
jgi:hypothetical protein